MNVERTNKKEYSSAVERREKQSVWVYTKENIFPAVLYFIDNFKIIIMGLAFGGGLFFGFLDNMGLLDNIIFLNKERFDATIIKEYIINVLAAIIAICMILWCVRKIFFSKSK